MEVVLREYGPDDKNLVYSTMLRGLYYGSDFYSKIEKKAFFAYYPHYLDLIMPPRSSNRLVVACLPDDPGVVLGWALYGPSGALHYIYVKTAFRNQGIATKLLENVKVSCVTHLTSLGDKLRLKKNLPFNPFLTE